MNILKLFNYRDKALKKDIQKLITVKRRFKFLVILAAAALAVSAFAVIFPDRNRPFIDSGISSIYMQSGEYPISVFVLDSGIANCVLVHCSEADILVDCGHEKADKNILEILDILDVDTLDLVILTHPDKDHIGNLKDVIETVSVKRFITCENGGYDLTELYESLLASLGSHDIDVETAKAGDSISFGRLTLDVVSPIMVYDTANNNSVVVKLGYGNFSALLTGDIGKKAENDILDSGADVSARVLLVPHHGSGSSSTEEFLSAVNPEYAIISVEQSNYQPNDKTMSRLISFGSEIYRTDKHGNIAVVSDGEEIKILTEYNY